MLTAIGATVLDHAAAPDAQGNVRLAIDGQVVGGDKGVTNLGTSYNKYTPAWSAGWSHIPLDCNHDVRLILFLEDYDPVGQNDQIGTVEVNRDDLIRAARLQKVVPVYVGDQSQNQLVFVNVSVTLDSGSQLPAGLCNTP